MLRDLNVRMVCAIAALTLLALVSVTCGGSSHNNVSQAQAQAISSELFAALNSALVGGPTPSATSGAVTRPSLGEIVERAHAQSSGCTITNTGQSCNIPITYHGPCPNGGSISVTGDFVFTLDNSGNGNDSSTLTVTPLACVVDNLTINGEPNVMFATQFNLRNNALAFPIMLSGTGGISFGPNPSGSCSINVKATATSATACSVTGSICGQTVSGNC
jgi:hypothetical protein